MLLSKGTLPNNGKEEPDVQDGEFTLVTQNLGELLVDLFGSVNGHSGQVIPASGLGMNEMDWRYFFIFRENSSIALAVHEILR